MWSRIESKLLGSRFVRRLTTLSGGFLLGQLLILASSPILTRLFTPAEFGVYAVFTALTGIFGNVLSMRYELAVPIAKGDRDAAALTSVAVLCVVASCAVASPLAWAGADWLARTTEMPELASLLWAVPVTIVLLSTAETASYWSVYRGTFRLNALGRLVQAAVQSGLQVLFGLLGFTAAGMVLGYGLGYLVRLGFMLVSFSPTDRLLLVRPQWPVAWRKACENWQYPAFSAPSALLEASTQLLPPIFLAMLFGPTLAGLFALGQRLMGLPIRLFAQAARQVFLGEAAQREPAAIFRLFKRTSLLFLSLGIGGMAPVLIAGPALFALVFGEAWRPAGEIVQLLVPLYLTRFVVTPVSQTLNILGRQKLHLVSSSLDAALMLTVFGATWLLDLPPMLAILLFSLGSTAAYSLYFLLAWGVARRHGLGVAAASRLEPHPPPLAPE
jgi:O-antigen/teichoic acid export membrane protein